VFNAFSAGFYRQAGIPLSGWREPNQQHQFITVEYAPKFLARHLGDYVDGLHPLVTAAIKDDSDRSGIGPAQRLTSEQQQMVQSLRHPPVFSGAQRLWYESKALELAAVFLFQPPADELFCDRQKRLAQERVEKVLAVLRADLCEPPSVEELGRRVGCSHFYLSRIFSKETGMTIPQYLRQLRMEKAAELLRSGKFNVTEAALEVGYSSLSHFSHAFHETFGCCPGLYPVAPNHAQIDSKE
jgi:AraC-like DNA-binding protein